MLSQIKMMALVLLPAVSSLVVAQEQEAAQVKGRSLCRVVFQCPGVCV